MTTVEERAAPLAAATFDARGRAEPPRRVGQAADLAPALLATSLTIVAVAVLADLQQGVLSGALVGMLVASVPVGDVPPLWISKRAPSGVLFAIAASTVAAVGALLASGDGRLVDAQAQLLLGWAAVILVVIGGSSAAGERWLGDRRAATAAQAAGVVGVVAAGIALLTETGGETAVTLLLAVPAALAVSTAATARRRDRAQVSVLVQLAALGALAGVVALVVVPDVGSSTALLILLVGTTMGVGLLLEALKAGMPVPPWMPAAVLAVALLAAGAGGGPLGLIAVGALVVARRRAISLAAPTDAIVVVDTSAVTARRIVVGLTAIALGLRLYAPRGLWLDEATSVHQARLPFGDMLRLIYREDNHPPLHHVLLWLDIRAVGDSELAVRLPAILLGVLLVPMLYVTGRELFDRRVGVIAAAIGTVAPLAVWYGQEARMYSQFMLLAIITVYAQVRILRGGTLRWWAVFTLASVALIYTQYFAVLHVAATLVVFAIELVRRRGTADGRRLIKGLAGSVAAGAVLLAPLVPFALYQAEHNQQSGFGFSSRGLGAGSPVVPPPSIYGFLTNIQWTVFGYQTDELTTRLVALWPIGLLLILLVLGRPRRTTNRMLLVIAGLPALVVFAASLFAAKSRSLAEVRYFIGAVPVVFLLLAAGLTTVMASRRLQAVATAALLGAMLVSLGLQETSGQNPRLYEYREAMADIRAESLPGDQVAYAPEYLDYVMEYYSPGLPSAPLEDGLPLPGGQVFLVQGASFADSTDAGAAIDAAIAELAARGMTVQERSEYAQITVWRLA